MSVNDSDVSKTPPTGDLSVGSLFFVIVGAAQIVWLGPLIWLVGRAI